MIRIFAITPPAPPLADFVSLLVPQGWAVRGFLLSLTVSR